MRKVFSAVRQKMLGENKFRNYIIYAIGEIILVVIGILIAIQINAFKPNTDSTLKFINHLVSDTVGSMIFSDENFNYPHLDTRTGEQTTIGYVPLDFEALKKDNKFLMLLEETKGYRNYKIKRYSSVQLVIKEVVGMIDRELE